MMNTSDSKLEKLNLQMIQLGAITEQAINSACKALINRDEEAIAHTARCEAESDEKQRQIEDTCLKLLLKQQPVAHDLLYVSAALKMITDMERIADQAADIAEIIRFLGDEPYIKRLEHLPEMAKLASEMVSASIAAFVARDITLARDAAGKDDDVDKLFLIIKNELTECILKDKSTASQALDLLMIAKYFERIGDHAENIAEWVVYSVTGAHLREV